MPEGVTHQELVSVATLWLRQEKRCDVVVSDRAGRNGERPDAIGWRVKRLLDHDGRLSDNAYSVLVECKAGNSDFWSDRRKPHRLSWGDGLGQERWYLAPRGLLRAEMLPERWGLLELVDGRVEIVVEAQRGKEVDRSVAVHDLGLMLRLLVDAQGDDRGAVVARSVATPVRSIVDATNAHRAAKRTPAIALFSVRAVLLQEIARGDGYGFGLATRLREATGGAVDLAEGSIYPALRELEAEGLIEAAGQESRGDRGGKPRKLYRVTSGGQREAQRQREIAAAVFFILEERQGRAGHVSAEQRPAAPGERWVVTDADAAEEGDEVANS